MQDTTITIIFQSGGGGGSESNPQSPGVTPNAQSPEQNAKKDNENSDVLTASKAMALYIGKQAVSTVTSRVGAVTRSNVAQTKVNAAMKMATYGGAIIGGLFTGNYLATGMAVISLGADMISSSIDYNTGSTQERLALNIQKEKAGISRSR